jgi:uncharacterized damage-inducible protein DinB
MLGNGSLIIGNIMTSQNTTTLPTFITPDALLAHWQGHRRVTRRTIEAFPEQEFFSLSIGGMRPFSEMVLEIIGMAVPTIQGAATGSWDFVKPAAVGTRAEMLALWDRTTEEINQKFGEISLQRFQETDLAFGQWKMTIHDLLLYIIDNEIHHRGQGTVYLRSLGVAPPPFFDRS